MTWYRLIAVLVLIAVATLNHLAGVRLTHANLHGAIVGFCVLALCDLFVGWLVTRGLIFPERAIDE